MTYLIPEPSMTTQHSKESFLEESISAADMLLSSTLSNQSSQSLSSAGQYKFHRYANLFPMMRPEELSSLVESIKQHGLREEIWLFQDQILDGRNRYQACLEADITPQFRQFTGTEREALAAVISWNFERRHLTSSQKAAIGVELDELLAELERRAKEQYAATVGRPRKQKKSTQKFESISEKRNERTSAAKAASILGTNRQYVTDARELRQTAPKVHEKVKQGALSLSQAKAIIALSPEQQQQVLVEVEQVANEDKKQKVVRDAVAKVTKQRRMEKLVAISQGNTPLETPEKFPVIYAAPPWEYDQRRTDSRSLDCKYPTMSLSEICELPVGKIATDPAILYLWVTSPMAEAGMQVIRAWGFQYRAQMVWVKDKIGMGFYARGKHELLYIATRGKMPVPDPSSLSPSVIQAPRGKHSEKPQEFYTVIERSYPELPKIELFARSPRAGWNAWGNQVTS